MPPFVDSRTSIAEPAIQSARPSRPSARRGLQPDVAIDFEPVPEGTLIRLRESGYQATPSGLRAMLNCSAGWGEALTLWKFFIEHGLRY